MEEILRQHWPFLGAVLIFAMIGEVMKSVVTKELARKRAWAALFRNTLPIHPVLAGVAIGWSNMFPASGGIEGPAGKAIYYGVTGVVSTWAFFVIKRVAAKKGIAIPDARPSVPPSEGNPDDETGTE